MKRTHETGTWIVPEMIRAYEDFHRAGYAFSVEVWDGEELIGGLYGVYLSGVLSGESMFFTVSGASKVALLGLITVSKGLGLRWMDTQMVSPVLETAGGRYIRRSDFLKRLIRDQGRESRPDLLRGLEERLLLLKPNECLPRD
jgi:leucyl/phenylalanyl-tRNA--protein transferase